MKKNLHLLLILIGSTILGYSQPTNIYQPNDATTNFGKVAADSLNYYVVNYPSLTLMKIDPSNNATQLTTLTADPFQTMIWNKGKGIFPVSSGSPFKLFDGTNQIDITGGQLPMAGYTLGNVIILDYFHIGNTTFFRTNDKIYKTDYSSPESIITLASRQEATGVGIMDMSHTTNSIIFQNIVSFASGVLRRIDLVTGNVSTLDSVTAMASFDKGIVYENEYYYCTPSGSPSLGSSKVFKISDSGIKSVVYTETSPSKYIRQIIGATPNGIIVVITDNTGANEYVAINAGVATSLNFGTFANSFPSNDYSGGVTTSSLVYFTAMDTIRSVAINKALWVTDGTLAGTKKIIGGPASTFNSSDLGQTLLGSAAFCGNDLFYKGRNGLVDGSLQYVNGTTFNTETYNYLPNPVTIRQNSSGIFCISKPNNMQAAKAVYKVNCGTTTNVAETNHMDENITLYPNPSKGQLNISIPNKLVGGNLLIYNFLGELVQTETINDQTSTLNLNLSAGLYFITMEKNGLSISKKLIIE